MKKRVIIIYMFTFFALLISSACSKNNHYSNKSVGYEITGPVNWYIYPSNDGGVSFAKYNAKKYGNSNINVLIEPLNSQAQSPLEYLNNILLPNTQSMFQEKENFTIPLISEPSTVEKNGRELATVKYWLPEDTYQVVYLTFSSKNVFIVALTSTDASQHVENEDLFLTALDSFKIYD